MEWDAGRRERKEIGQKSRMKVNIVGVHANELGRKTVSEIKKLKEKS